MQDAGDSNTKAVEDCLNLDIFTPAAAGQRPVLLWFYGGAFVAGAAAGLSAEAAWPLVAEQDCVLVVPDTRVGAFGYLGSERARRNSTGNWGTLDQLLALAWVSDNIAYFGGDPGRITIGGWSSGAAAASVLLSSLGESQPLQGAIMSSGGFTDWAAFGMKTAEENYDALLKAVGCQASPECQREGPACSCLLTVPAESLVAAGDGISWAPIIDGILVKLSPMDALRAGKVKSVPIILGSCLEEGMAALPSDATPADFKSWVKGIVPEAHLREAFDLYMGAAAVPALDGVHRGHSPAYWAMRRAAGDRGMTCVARRVAAAWPRQAFQYVWESRFPGEDTSGFGPGFAHEADQRFLFQAGVPAAWLPAARALRQKVGAFLHGSYAELAPWPVGEGQGLIFQDHGPVASSIRSEQCDFWDGLGGP